MLQQPRSLPQPARYNAMNQQEHKAQQRKANVRTGLILASIAIVFFVGFMAKMVYLQH